MAQEKRRISIIVPVYNTAPYLSACAESLLAQTYEQWELLLVDDGSTDGSGGLCDELAGKDPRIRVFHQKNAGVSAARNRGLEAASGDFICFADSDDRLEPAYLEHLIALTDKTEAELAGCGFSEDRRDGLRYPCRELGTVVFEPKEFLYRVISDPDCGVRLSCWGWLYSRQLIGDTRFDPSLAYGEDSLFLASILKKCSRIAYDPVPLYRYRVDREGNTVGRISLEKNLKVLQSWNSMAALFPEEGPLACLFLKLQADHTIRAAAQAREEGDATQEKRLKLKARELGRRAGRCRYIGRKDRLRIRLFAIDPAGMLKLYRRLKG